MSMRAITIVQPYAALICLPDNCTDCKRVENRSWAAHYRGKLIIHAGKSRERLDEIDEYPGLDRVEMVFGAAVAVARLTGCFMMDGVAAGLSRSLWTPGADVVAEIEREIADGDRVLRGPAV